MKILLEIGVAKAGFGVAQDEENGDVFLLSRCCGKAIDLSGDGYRCTACNMDFTKWATDSGWNLQWTWRGATNRAHTEIELSRWLQGALDEPDLQVTVR